MPSVKHALLNRLKQAGAYDARIADPHAGYEHALPGQHPLELWAGCRSVVVFAVACSPRTNNTYAGPYAPWPGERALGPVPHDMRSDDHAMDRLSRLFAAAIALRGVEVLVDSGAKVCFARPQLKLSAYEAGLGVYGRSGLILHPVLGNRLRFGLIMTDATLAPDGRLEGYEPCVDCDRCITACPAKAYDPALPYPDSWSREKCVAKRAEIAHRNLYCHNCYAVCPASQIEDGTLLRVSEAHGLFGEPQR